ncbi:MAG: voltage-gated potassium channel protein [Acetobacteraceae bacterium]
MPDEPVASAPGDLGRRLGFDAGQRLRRELRALQRRLRLGVWFPHTPLFLVVIALGVLMVHHALGVGVANFFSLHDLLQASRGAATAVLDGAPSAVVSGFLIVMAFGLLTRSRLAWAVSLIAAAASFALILLVWRGGPASHAGSLVYNGFVVALLLAFGGTFGRSSVASATLFATISTVLVLAYAVLGSLLLGQDFSPPIHDLVTALYYTIVTMSTVGYGDIVPKTDDARLFAVSIIVLGITVFATSLSALLVPMITRRMESLVRPRGKPMPRRDHYVVVSDSALARNTCKELKARDQPITMILTRAPEAGSESDDVVPGDATDLAVLRRAGVGDARAILALGADDSDNAFVVMAARELSEHVKTVAAVNDARNMARVRRVRPDLIIAPQVLGGELLAMALSGEKLETEQMMEKLLHFTT